MPLVQGANEPFGFLINQHPKAHSLGIHIYLSRAWMNFRRCYGAGGIESPKTEQKQGRLLAARHGYSDPGNPSLCFTSRETQGHAGILRMKSRAVLGWQHVNRGHHHACHATEVITPVVGRWNFLTTCQWTEWQNARDNRSIYYTTNTLDIL